MISRANSEIESLGELQIAQCILEIQCKLTTSNVLRYKSDRSDRTWRRYAQRLEMKQHIHLKRGRLWTIDAASQSNLINAVKSNPELLAQPSSFNKLAQLEHQATMRRRLSPMFGPLNMSIDVRGYRISKETVARWRKRMAIQMQQAC